MALREGGNANIKYLRLREGKFYVGKDKDQPFGELEGLITGMAYKDEVYEGAPVRKLIVTLQDGEEVYKLGLNTDSQNYSTFVSFLKGADLTEKVTLHPKIEVGKKDDKEFKKNSLLISQDGTFLKGYFTKDNMHGAPEWKKVKVGKKVVIDKAEYLDFLEKFVAENYISKLPKGVAAPVKEAKPKQPAIVDSNDDEPADEKLPWED